MRVMIWFRNDLRLHDHAPLHAALAIASQLIPIYCFDPRQFGVTSFGFPKTGSFRAEFLCESVLALRTALRARGSDLIIPTGMPEQILPELAQRLQCDAVYYHQEATTEEVAVESQLNQALDALGIRKQVFWGSTLHSLDALPFSLPGLPELFTQFRKAVEAKATVLPPLPTPTQLPPCPPIDPGDCPSLQQWGLVPPSPDPRATMSFKGGEVAGLARLEDYIWKCDRLRVYKQTRNGMLNPEDASKLSPWLALGCLSPRYIYQQVQQYETERVKNDSTYWLIFELLWRDYFRWICLKHGAKVFRASGLRGLKLPWRTDWESFNQWRKGLTGYPLVDANMRELWATGFMSNRGRQNVASFLTKNLGLHWHMGAEWFESQLIDYDVCSNWGNWNYTAGVGNDARGFRFFNILKQSQDYDAQGEYVKHWLPELAQVPAALVHTPWKLSPMQQQQYSVCIGVDYPQPMVELWASAKANERLYNQAQDRFAKHR